MKHSQGFTLIEALVVLVISTVLVFIAEGAWSTLQLRMEGRSTIMLLVSSLSDARNTAISRHTSVSICGSSNASDCNGHWKDGVLVFHDAKKLGKPEFASDILAFYGLKTQNASISWKGFGAGNIMRYDRHGRPSISNGSFTYCPGTKDNHYARQIVINRGGRVRYSLDRNGDGIHEDASGNSLSCH